MFDVVYAEKSINYEKIYKLYPFNTYTHCQYPGNVIQYLLMQLADVRHNGAEKECVKTVFELVCNEINNKTIVSFTAKDCATTLHRITLLITEFKDLSVSEDIINRLIAQLYKQPNRDTTQAIANGLWSVVRLLELGIKFRLNPVLINGLIKNFAAQRICAEPPAVSTTLSSIAKLIGQGQVATIENHCLAELIEVLHVNRDQSATTNLSNGLWAIAKIIQATKKTSINAAFIRDIYEELSKPRNNAALKDIIVGLWACGIVNTVTPISIKRNLVKSVIDESSKSGLDPIHKKYLLTGIGKLGLNDIFDLNHLKEDGSTKVLGVSKSHCNGFFNRKSHTLPEFNNKVIPVLAT